MALASALAHLHIGGHHAAAGAGGGPVGDVLHCPRQLTGPARLGSGLSASLAPLPPAQLDYTQRDWSRWDTFDLTQYTVAGVKRRQHGLGGGEEDPLLCEQPGKCAAAAPAQSAEHCYFHLFRLSVLYVFWRESHQRFRCLQVVKPEQENGCDDWLAKMRKDKQLPVEQVANFLANSLSQEYNYWRMQQRERAAAEVKAAHAQQAGGATLDPAALDRQVDMLVDSTPFVPRTHPPCAPTIAWFNELTRTHLSFQCLDPTLTLSSGSPFGEWKPFGHWPKASDEKVFEQNLHYWRASGISVLYGHFLHLLDDDLIRAVRRAMYASLAAQYEWHLRTSAGKKHHLESQWLLRISGFAIHAFVLLRSEAELRTRGVWHDETDGCIKQTDRTTGAWVTSELVSFSEELLGEVHTRMRQFGQTEFLSSYYGYASDILGDLQLHAPSQKCYDMACDMMDRLQWDLAAHLMPSSGTFSGPSGRSYDLFAGCHNATDRIDMPMYFQHCFEPYCRPPEQQCIMRRRCDGTALRADLRMDALLGPTCAWNQGHLPTLVPPSGTTDPNWHRLWLAMSQLAGTGSLPFRAIERLPIALPYRIVEQRFSNVVGQERYNFLTPHLQMGHAGEDAVSLATALLACARLGGAAASQAPVAVVNHGDTHCNSFVRLFPRVAAANAEGGADPCWRPSLRGVAGDNRMAFSRQIAVQYQGFMLISQLLAPVAGMKPETLAGTWDSNLMLPLSVDELTIDATPLPRAVGTRLRLYPHGIFTARHGGAVVAVRLASFTKEDDITHSEAVAPVSEAEGAAVPVEWIVDESSASCGCGRVVVHHRRKQDASGPAQPPVKPYRVLWLWGSGVTSNEGETRALQIVLRSAHMSERVEVSAGWKEREQLVDSYPPPFPASSTEEVGEQRWLAEAFLASGALKLSIARTDVYHPWSHAPAYREPESGPMHVKPYHYRDVARTVNGQPVLRWAEGEDAYRVRGLQPQQLFEPHRPGGCTQVFTDLPVSERPPA